MTKHINIDRPSNSELEKQIDEFLLQYLAYGHKTLTVTFSGEVGDDTKVFQTPYHTFRQALIYLIDKQIIEELGRIYQNASYAEDRTAKEVIDRLESRLTQLRTTK